MRARRPDWSTRLPVALLLAGILAGTTGCASTPDHPGIPATSGTPVAPTGADGLPHGVSVRIYQTRFDYADRVLELSVTNAGPAPVDTLTLAWAVPGTDSANVPATATVPALDDTGALDRIEGEDCLAGALRQVLRIDVAPKLRVDGAGPVSTAWLDLTLTPTGGPGVATIDQAGSTPLLASATGLDWPVGLTLDATTPPTRISLGLRPARCDPHAIAEDKRGTVFPLTVRVTVGPGSPERAGDWDLAVDDALRARLYTWIADRCGY
ncbi:hypothetical protein E3O19_10065 [Cryobacterium algoritolerans]|uniref:DUF4232 domain-containing protein n=1 Tax=Cryobacterium algoritolerans TaxID=1259184 RepID=A0A4R8WVQ6_9MICO|nr:hypothetical protein [Cryobacterium algoritolerans]TFC14543.1 hypothetical protein E3O19_10065 [Cryobacterium algoritolerans]